MSDLKVLRLVKKSEGELPAKAFKAEAVARPAPKPATAPVTKPVAAPQLKTRLRRGKQPRKQQQDQPNLSRAEMLQIFRTMYLSRRLDDKEIQMKGQNRIF